MVDEKALSRPQTQERSPGGGEGGRPPPGRGESGGPPPQPQHLLTQDDRNGRTCPHNVKSSSMTEYLVISSHQGWEFALWFFVRIASYLTKKSESLFRSF